MQEIFDRNNLLHGVISLIIFFNSSGKKSPVYWLLEYNRNNMRRETSVTTEFGNHGGL